MVHGLQHLTEVPFVGVPAGDLGAGFSVFLLGLVRVTLVFSLLGWGEAWGESLELSGGSIVAGGGILSVCFNHTSILSVTRGQRP